MIEKRNIFLIGPMGAGKSTIGRQLSQMLGMNFFDSDQEIEASAGVGIDWIFDVEGEDGFHKRELKILNELTTQQGIVLSTGGGSVVSKVARNILSARGIVVYLKTPVEKQYKRTLHDKTRPLLQTQEDTRTVLEKLATVREPLYEEIADITISTDNKNTKNTVSTLITLLEEYIRP
ncbi:MAG: shikimate kinase AroK [Psittacicella sp.]